MLFSRHFCRSSTLAMRTPTALSRATAFLWGDYTAAAYCWEPLEMCRKLTLTGWVLLIDDDAEQARVLVALLVSMAIFGLRLSIRPLRRCAAASWPRRVHAPANLNPTSRRVLPCTSRAGPTIVRRWQFAIRRSFSCISRCW